MKNLAIVCFLILAGVPNGVGHARAREVFVHQPPPSVCGRWVVERFLLHGMKASPEHRLLGLKAEYTASRMQFGRLVVSHPLYRVRRWSSEKFFREFYLHLSGLGIQKSVLVVDVIDEHGKDVVAPGARLFVRNRNQMIMYSNGLLFIMEWEGEFHSKVYDASGKKHQGDWTIGFGHRVSSPKEFPNGITRAQGVALLKQDVATAVAAVNRDVTAPLSQNQFDALVSFTFDEGTGSLLTSAIRTRINAGESVSRHDFTEWDRSGHPSAFDAGLLNRRTAEYNLFSNGDYGDVKNLATANGVGHAQAREALVHQPPPSVCGRWVVKRFLLHGMKASPERRLLELKAEYTASRMQFGKLVVSHPLYRVRRWSSEKFFREFYLHLSGLGIQKSVLVVDVVDEHGKDVSGPGTMLFVRNRNQVIMGWNGVFYLMERKGAPCAEASPRRK